MARITLRSKVHRALYAAGKPTDRKPNTTKVMFEPVPGGRLICIVVSHRFRRMSAARRQEHVWEYLDQMLTRDEQRRVLFVLVDTPEEHADHYPPPTRRSRVRVSVHESHALLE